MMNKLASMALLLILWSCGNAPSYETGIKTTDDLIHYIVSAESDEALVYQRSSPFGQQALRRTAVNSLDDLQKVGPISRNAKLAIQFSPKATQAQMQQIARYGKTALRNPRNTAVLGGLLATGAVVSYIILEEEGPGTPAPLPGSTGSNTIALGDTAPAEEVIAGLKQYQLPTTTLNAIAEELKVQPLKTKRLRNYRVAHFPYRSDKAAITATQFTLTNGPQGKAILTISVTGTFTAATELQVKARILDSQGKPVKNYKARHAAADGKVEVVKTLPASTLWKFHQYTADMPLTFTLPVSDFDPLGLSLGNRCRVEAYHPTEGLLAATGALAIER